MSLFIIYKCANELFTCMKEGEVFELNGKTFTKWAGLLVAPDMEACELIKTNEVINQKNILKWQQLKVFVER